MIAVTAGTKTSATAEPKLTISAPVGPDEEAAASWMTPLALLLGPACRVRFWSTRRDDNEAFDEALLLSARLRLAFSTRTSASAMARSMSSMLSGSCEKHVPAFDADGPISECIV